jgi:DNA-binding response OmpR family regulator
VSKRVLIVEDERLLARTLSSALRDIGYDTVVAHTAESGGRHWLRSDGFDLVILDNRLPKQSGLELLRDARDRGRSSKVIFMTAFDRRGVQTEATGLAVDRYVRKPFDLDSMLETVRDLIGAAGNGGSNPTQEGGEENHGQA